jgi:hypothetical protein
VEIGAYGIDLKHRIQNGIDLKKAENISFLAIPYLEFQKDRLKSTYRH